MDDTPFTPFTARDLDVVMLYDYTDLTFPQDLADTMLGYKEVFLIAWSMGVWVAQKLFSSMTSKFVKTIAVNGTLCPIHDRYGIPVEVFSSTLTHFDETARLKFYRRMCRKREILAYFLTNQPKRKIDNQKKELESLLSTIDCSDAENSMYTDIVIADTDLIMPTENQRMFWKQSMPELVDGHHFLFYGWNSWDAMLRDLGKCSEAVNNLAEKDRRTHEQ